MSIAEARQFRGVVSGPAHPDQVVRAADASAGDEQFAGVHTVCVLHGEGGLVVALNEGCNIWVTA